MCYLADLAITRKYTHTHSAAKCHKKERKKPQQNISPPGTTVPGGLKSHWSGHRLVTNLCEEADCSDFDVFSECTVTTSRSWPGNSVLSSTEILESAESDVHLGSSSTSADVSDIYPHRREVRRSSKGSLLVDYPSVSAKRIACLLCCSRSRYKGYKLLNSLWWLFIPGKKLL